MKQALTIAGSDSGGGAGIQADLKTFHAHGIFGTSVITAVTAQNTVAVSQALDLPIDLIQAQLDAVLGDFDISAAKTGMLSSTRIIHAVSESLRDRRLKTLVVDPVMISKSGYKLLRDDAIRSLKEELRERLIKRGEELDIPDLLDRIADETVGLTEDEILPFLTEKNHPALAMDPIIG